MVGGLGLVVAAGAACNTVPVAKPPGEQQAVKVRQEMR